VPFELTRLSGGAFSVLSSGVWHHPYLKPAFILTYCASPQCAQLLIKHGANLEGLDKYMQTPAHWASWNGHAPVLQVLLESGANVNAKDSKKCTPLYNAAYIGGEGPGWLLYGVEAARMNASLLRHNWIVQVMWRLCACCCHSELIQQWWMRRADRLFVLHASGSLRTIATSPRSSSYSRCRNPSFNKTPEPFPLTCDTLVKLLTPVSPVTRTQSPKLAQFRPIALPKLDQGTEGPLARQQQNLAGERLTPNPLPFEWWMHSTCIYE
jgi:hypothetical protein